MISWDEQRVHGLMEGCSTGVCLGFAPPRHKLFCCESVSFGLVGFRDHQLFSFYNKISFKLEGFVFGMSDVY